MRGPLMTWCKLPATLQSMHPLYLLKALLAAGLALLGLSACNNNPWPELSASTNTLHTAVIETSPRHLDPTASYWNNDTPYTYQIYEPPYGYHYLKRPFQLCLLYTSPSPRD